MQKMSEVYIQITEFGSKTKLKFAAKQLKGTTWRWIEKDDPEAETGKVYALERLLSEVDYEKNMYYKRLNDNKKYSKKDCMNCGNEFPSTGEENRICNSCKRIISNFGKFSGGVKLGEKC